MPSALCDKDAELESLVEQFALPALRLGPGQLRSEDGRRRIERGLLAGDHDALFIRQPEGEDWKLPELLRRAGNATNFVLIISHEHYSQQELNDIQLEEEYVRERGSDHPTRTYSRGRGLANLGTLVAELRSREMKDPVALGFFRLLCDYIREEGGPVWDGYEPPKSLATEDYTQKAVHLSLPKRRGVVTNVTRLSGLEERCQHNH